MSTIARSSSAEAFGLGAVDRDESRGGRVVEILAVFILALSIAAAFSFCFLGLGTEADSYRNLAVWQHILLTGQYLPTRTPGHLATEMIIGLLTSTLPIWGANLVVFAAALGSLALFWFLVRPTLGAASTLVALAMVASSPNWIVLASSSDDTMYAVLFFLAGVAALARGAPALTAALFALAVSARSEYGPLCGIALLAFGGAASEPRRRWLDGLIYAGVFGLIVSLLYLPSMMSHQMTLAFLEPLAKVGGIAQRIGRWGYKIVMTLGIPAALALAAAVLWRIVEWRRGRSATPADSAGLGAPAALAAVALVAYFIAFFFYYPMVENPLVPAFMALPVALLAAGVRRSALIVVALLQVTHWFVTPSLVTIDYASRGLGYKTTPVAARFEPRLQPGWLIQEARERPLYEEFFLMRMPIPGDPRDAWAAANERSPRRGRPIGIDQAYEFYLK